MMLLTEYLLRNWGVNNKQCGFRLKRGYSSLVLFAPRPASHNCSKKSKATTSKASDHVPRAFFPFKSKIRVHRATAHASKGRNQRSTKAVKVSSFFFGLKPRFFSLSLSLLSLFLPLSLPLPFSFSINLSLFHPLSLSLTTLSLSLYLHARKPK